MSAVETLRTKYGRMMEFCTATDGNHGYGVGWFARKMGCQAHVYMPGVVIRVFQNIWRYRNQSFLSATLPPDQGKALGFAVELSFLLSQGL